MKQEYDQKTTEELVAILAQRDEVEWSPQDFQEIARILKERELEAMKTPCLISEASRAKFVGTEVWKVEVFEKKVRLTSPDSSSQILLPDDVNNVLLGETTWAGAAFHFHVGKKRYIFSLNENAVDMVKKVLRPKKLVYFGDTPVAEPRAVLRVSTRADKNENVVVAEVAKTLDNTDSSGQQLIMTVGEEALKKQSSVSWTSNINDVPHAYQSSEESPAMALVLMILSVPFITVLGFVSLVIIIPIASFFGRMGSIVVLFIPRVLSKMLNLKDTLKPFMDGLDILVTNLAASILLGLAIGHLCGYGIGFAGRLGKNRNSRVSKSIAVITVFLLLGGIIVVTVTSMLPVPPVADSRKMLILSTVVATLIAVLGARTTGGVFASKPFCEQHQKFMRCRKLPTISYSAARQALDILNNAGIDAFVHKLEDSESGTSGVPLKYMCTICNSGYMELNVTVKHNGIESTLCAASVALPVNMASRESATNIYKSSV